MRLITPSLILAFLMPAAPLAMAAAQAPRDSTTPDTTKKVKKPSKVGNIAKGLAGPAATAAAGAGVQSALGDKAAGVANALGVGAGTAPCTGAASASSGAAIVGLAKGIVKKATEAVPTDAAAPCPQGAAATGVATGAAGMAAGAFPGMGGAAAPPASPMGGAGNALLSATPVGMAITAAPLAAGAVKGLKGVLGGKPQDKIAMLRELGKGTLILKGVKFIEGTAEMEPGFEPSFAALGEAVTLAEGTYILHVAAEADKGAEPDTVLQRKRIQKVWAAVLVNGVPDQRIIAVAVLPKEMAEGRKPPKPGQARVEIIRMVEKP